MSPKAEAQPKHMRPSRPWGGAWTEQKLKAVTKYLSAFTKILRNKGLDYWYIDAFAGAGFREVPRLADIPTGGLFETVPDRKEMRQFMAGSAYHALKGAPPFLHYVFCERDAASMGALQRMVVQEFPEHAKAVRFESGDANAVIKGLCSGNWKARRAVMFLDPFGMEVEWDTLCGITRTKGVDLWILFPVGAINRMVMKDGRKIPTNWERLISRQFGTDAWRQRFYGIAPQLFDRDSPRPIKVASPDDIVAFYLERLRTIFPYVAPKPLKLTNSRGSPLYALCFAAANPREGAGGLGAKIAHQILLKS